MKNSFIIKSNEHQRFDSLYKKMILRKKNSNQMANKPSNVQLPSIEADQIALRSGSKIPISLNRGKRPAARDGHTGIFVLN